MQLLRAVAEECVDAEEILPGGTGEECKLNAKYAISCAFKMGCAVFLVWEDIVEVRPKMVLCLMAAVMAIDMQRKKIDKSELLQETATRSTLVCVGFGTNTVHAFSQFCAS